MPMPVQKPGKSKQDYGTPVEFIAAVERRFGELVWDLAATAANAKAPNYITPEQDSLRQDWDQFAGLKWLNPPFANIGAWARKCSRSPCSRIIMLTPASVGTEWFADHCHGKCSVIFIRPRLTFEGTTPNPKTGKLDPYPKDCMLTIWGIGTIKPYDIWRWL